MTLYNFKNSFHYYVGLDDRTEQDLQLLSTFDEGKLPFGYLGSLFLVKDSTFSYAGKFQLVRSVSFYYCLVLDVVDFTREACSEIDETIDHIFIGYLATKNILEKIVHRG